MLRSLLGGCCRYASVARLVTANARVLCASSNMCRMASTTTTTISWPNLHTAIIPTTQVRQYSGKAPLTLKTLEERIILVLSLYDKIDPAKLTMDSKFVEDLGLDSLDHVEVIMALEDEFGFEIPDGDADQMKTPRDIFKYICDKEDVYE